MTRGALIRFGVLVAWLVAGCADDVTAIDFELVPDPNINTTAQVVSAIDSVQIILDSEDGLYEPADAVRTGNLQIRDYDRNPLDLELAVLVAVPRGRLPVVRLLRGGLPDVPLSIKVIGLRGAEDTPSIALGAVRGVRFEPGRVVTVQVPFNIRDALLPPRVVDVQPRNDGGLMAGCNPVSIAVGFSRAMSLASLMADGTIRTDPGGMPTGIRLSNMDQLVTFEPTGLGTGDGTTVSYGLMVSSAALARDGGEMLDQVPMEDAAQGYAGDFVLTCGMAMLPDRMPCGSAPPPLGSFCPGNGRLACVDGQCVFASCENANCVDGYVCDPTTFACTADCRPYGDDICPTERPVCDATTGSCQ